MIGTAHSGNAINVQTITFTGAQVPRYPARFAEIPTGAALPRPSVQFFDPDFENPEVHQASAGVEYALNDDIALGASYLFVAGRNLQRSRDFNVGTPVPTPVPVQGSGSITHTVPPPGRSITSTGCAVREHRQSEYNGLRSS